jgi:hypothetical protein
MPISDDLKKIYVTAPVDDYYVECLTIHHQTMQFETAHITNQVGGFTGTLENGDVVAFRYLPFVVIPPRSAEDAALSLQVAIDNSSRELMESLETISQTPTSPVEMSYRVYLASDPTTLQNNPPLDLDITAVTTTKSLVTFSAGMTNLRTRPFPSVLYTTTQFPGLLR